MLPHGSAHTSAKVVRSVGAANADANANANVRSVLQVIADPMIILQLGTLKWTRKQSQMFTAVVGLGLLIGSKVTKKSMA